MQRDRRARDARNVTHESVAFYYFETAEYVVGVPRRQERKPRVFVVQPQRLFMEALSGMLANDFEVVGIGATFPAIERAEQIDLIVVDADALQMPRSALVQVPGVLDCEAIVCLLSLNASLGISGGEPVARLHFVPKTTTEQQFIETLLRLVAHAKAFNGARGVVPRESLHGTESTPIRCVDEEKVLL